MPDNTIFLRFADQREALKVLRQVGISCQVDKEQTLRLPCYGVIGKYRYILDHLFTAGTISHPTGELASFEGEAMALTTTLPGLHLNLSFDGPVPDPLHSYTVQPAVPVVRFVQ